VEDRLVGELERVVAGGLAAAETARARRLLVADWAFSRETVGQEALAAAAGLALFGADHARRHLERIESCSGEELDRVASCHLAPDGLVVGWSLPEVS
jgi:predicted Zn-dependent peptidase